jgi:hypothetical protein
MWVIREGKGLVGVDRGVLVKCRGTEVHRARVVSSTRGLPVVQQYGFVVWLVNKYGSLMKMSNLSLGWIPACAIHTLTRSVRRSASLHLKMAKVDLHLCRSFNTTDLVLP